MNRSTSILASCRNIYVPHLSQRDPSSAFYISRYRILPPSSLLESPNPTPHASLANRPIRIMPYFSNISYLSRPPPPPPPPISPTPPLHNLYPHTSPYRASLMARLFRFSKSIVEMVWVVGSEVEGRRVCVIGCLR